MDNVKYHGKIIEVVEKTHDGRVFEIARRSPGVRALIVKDNKMLLSREFRTETNNYDFRLPGGKVFDKLNDYNKFSDKNLLPFAQDAVIKEVYEEVGLIARSPKLIKVSKAGATIEWDLYYFEINDFKTDKQHLEDGEDITFEWYSFDEVLRLCQENMVQEDRSVGVILNYLIKNMEFRKSSGSKTPKLGE